MSKTTENKTVKTETSAENELRAAAQDLTPDEPSLFESEMKKVWARLAELENENKELRTDKETKKNAPDNASKWNKRVSIKLFYDGEKYKDDVFVGWNGKRYRIKRGVEVNVPLGVFRIIQRSEEMDRQTAARIQRLVDDYKE